MSLGSGPMSPRRRRLLEQAGWGAGIAAGGVVLLCVWCFAIVQHFVGMIVSAPPASRF